MASEARGAGAGSPRIVEARVAPGHDGEAELVLRIRFENGGLGSVTLRSQQVERLLERCSASSVEGLLGQPAQLLFDLLDAAAPAPDAA